MTYTHVNAPTQFVQANGIRFAYRRFGKDSAVPLLFMQHFRGGMDHWDPAVTDGFPKDRPVILFDNAGVASSTGETPDTIDAMAENAADFLNALGVSKVDLLGFSIGGCVAQAFTLTGSQILVQTDVKGSSRCSFPGAAEVAETFSYFQAHSYLGSDSCDEIALANKIAGRQPANFSTWARLSVPVQTP